MGHAQLLQRGTSYLQLIVAYVQQLVLTLKLYFPKFHLITSSPGLHEARAGRSGEGTQPWQKPGQLVREQGGALRPAQEARLPARPGQEG